MKTTIDVNGYSITIEELEGNVQVSAILDDETVEEFTLEPVEEGDEGEDLKAFKDFEEGEDFDEEPEGDLEMDEPEEEEDIEGTLESFQTFINKPKNKKK